MIFFATVEDLKPVIEAVESRFELQYLQCGLFAEEKRPIFASLSSIDQLGIPIGGDTNFGPTYLVLDRQAQVNIRTVPQQSGGTKFAVDQMINPGSITLRPGGKYSDSAVISGMVDTVRTDSKAKELMKAFSKEFRKRYIPVKGSYIGPCALSLHRDGARLTSSVFSPVKFDLLE